PNAQVLEVPLESIFDTIEADKLILSDIRQDPKFAGAIRAALASLGSPVPADKFQTVSIEEGDEKVTYQVDARGNRKEIARAPLWKPEGATTAERNFARAQSDPAFAEYQERMKRAGATSVNVGGSEKEFDKNLGKQLAEQYGEIQKGAQSARSKIATLDALDAALQGAGRTGTGAKTVLAAKRAIGLFGGDPNVSDEEAVVALGNQLALQMRNPSGGAGMPGALSDKDREFLVASVPGIEKTAGGNRQLIDYMKRIEQRSIDVAKMADDYMRENGGRLDYAFYDKLAKWADANPLFPEASGGQAGPNVGHVEDGYVFKGGDPANPDSWERAK
ncbi:MAG TPA: hypothetical protein DDW98_09220, partial [Gammaproteobacteria bacterium]|nr:hypothetical protein [Gammaproteobacteria bacterium]